MKNSLKFIAFLSIVSLVIFSCKKENDDDPKPAPTKAQMLIGNWKMNAWTVNPPLPELDSNLDTIYISDFYAHIEDCYKDNLMVFKEHNIYLLEEGEIKCYSNSPPIIENGNWTLSSDEKYIAISSINTTSTKEIKSLSSSLLELIFYQQSWQDSTIYVNVQQFAKQ